MDIFTYQFAMLFRKKRDAHALSLWKLAQKINYHPRNIQKIEHAERQPGVHLAVRLVMALDENVGDFFEELHKLCMESGDKFPMRGDVAPWLDNPSVPEVGAVRYMFGPFLRQYRNRQGIPQKHVAEIACYSLRNLVKVEKGEQEPGVMTALAMVVAVKADVKSFFNHLSEHIEEK